MTATEAETLRNASLLHDVGKIGVPDAILLQPSALSDADREQMRLHTTVGAELLSGASSDVMRMAEEIARTHHERWDGEGYPAGLAGEAIPLVGRICAVCDVFDALLSDRPYKEPWPLDEALAQLRRDRGAHFDPTVVDAFLRIVDSLDPGAAGARVLARPQRPRQAIRQRLQQQLLARVEDQQRRGRRRRSRRPRAAGAGRGPRRPRAARRGDRRRGRPRARRRPPPPTSRNHSPASCSAWSRAPARARRAARLAASAPSRSARLRSRVGRKSSSSAMRSSTAACASSPSAFARTRISSHGRSASSSCSAPRAKASAPARSFGPSPKASRAARSASPRPRRAQACAIVGSIPCSRRGDLVGARRVEAHVLAARGDRRQDLARAVGEQHEVREGGGLLERLEHPVGGLVVHRLGALDHEHAPARLERGPRRRRHDGLVDVGDEHLRAAAGRHPGEVGMHAVVHARANRVGVGRAVAQQRGGEGARDASPCPSPRGRGRGRRGWAGRRAAARR